MRRYLLPIAILAGIALFLIAACGGDGGPGAPTATPTPKTVTSDDGFTPPPAGTYEFDVTGSIEVEFSEAGASIAPVRLQQTVTGQVEGTAIVEVLANGPDTFGDLQLTLTIEREGDTIRIGLRHVPGQESTVLINPQGTGIGLIIDFILESLDDTEVPLGQVEAIIKGPGDPFTQDEWTGRVSDIALPIAGDFDGDGMDDGLVLRDGEFVFTRIRFDASEATAAPAEPSGSDLPDPILTLAGILGFVDPSSSLPPLILPDAPEPGLQPFIDVTFGGTMPATLPPLEVGP